MGHTENQTCLIVGASHAGVNAAFALRRQGWRGRIVLFDRDPELPYHRPPLSKGLLSGATGVEDGRLKSAESYAKERIELRRGTTVAAILPVEKTLRLADGASFTYDKIILATGANAFLPPISGLADHDGVFTLRTAADAHNIREAFSRSSAKKVVVIGGGYIGLEAAASLRKLGGDVTVLERAERVLARVTSPEMSAFFTALHADHGVDIAVGRNVTQVIKEDNGLRVYCDDGSSYPADLVIAGVGVTVNTSLAEAAGLEVANGIRTDADMCTSAPDVYAIGDCTSFYHPRYDQQLRLESVQNAVDQARVAAANICGGSAEYNAVPWFWSDQYDVKLQIAGLATGYDRLVARHETGDDPYQRSFWYFRAGQLLAVDAINHARAYMLGMKMLKSGVDPNPEKLADTGVALHPVSIV